MFLILSRIIEQRSTIGFRLLEFEETLDKGKIYKNEVLVTKQLYLELTKARLVAIRDSYDYDFNYDKYAFLGHAVHSGYGDTVTYFDSKINLLHRHLDKTFKYAKTGNRITREKLTNKMVLLEDMSDLGISKEWVENYLDNFNRMLEYSVKPFQDCLIKGLLVTGFELYNVFVNNDSYEITVQMVRGEENLTYMLDYSCRNCLRCSFTYKKCGDDLGISKQYNDASSCICEIIMFLELHKMFDFSKLFKQK